MLLRLCFAYYSHLAQGNPAKITAAASQMTERINIIVTVCRVIQVFIAREVNKRIIMLLFSDRFFKECFVFLLSS